MKKNENDENNENNENDIIQETKKIKENEEYIPLEMSGTKGINYYNNKIRNLRIIISVLIIIIFIIISLFIYYILKNKSETVSKISFIKNILKINNKTIITENNTNNNAINPNNNSNNDTNISIISGENNNITSGQKRKIYVKYMDFWPAFVLKKFDVHKILLEKYEVIQSSTPDYVIFSQFGANNIGIENRINCVKLFLSIENRDPNFDITDYAIGIHYIQNGDRYFRKPTETHELTKMKTVYDLIQKKNIDISKKKFCAWVVSNGGGSVRNKFFDKLSEYKKVDSGGRFRNNIGERVGNKIKFLSNYKFSICFENSKTPGYISEKLVDSFKAGTIPIYYGDDTVLELLNNRSYIHVIDENDFENKIELIKKIDNNDTLYQEMIREKIVIDDTRYPKEFQKYKDFIYHIIDQDKEKAKRFKRKNETFNYNNTTI